MHDIVIIGAGPAGLTAAVYARRAGKSVLVLEKECFGGQITYSPKVENYPAFPAISGNELGEKMVEQAMNFGVEIELDTATAIRDLGNEKVVLGEYGSYPAKAVIIAAGSKHRQLGLPREEELTGHGVSYCALCDGAFYKGKNIAVIGGGNTALQDAVLLSEICTKVTIIQNLAECTGEKLLVEKLRNTANVEFIFNTVVEELVGTEELSAIVLRNSANGEVTRFNVDGIFVAIGQKPENQPFAAVCDLNEYGYIDAGEDTLTKTPGIFVAGDCRSKHVRQVVTATGDGAVAALSACRYIDSL
jgi:thioredoxin reductase (NADPH)